MAAMHCSAMLSILNTCRWAWFFLLSAMHVGLAAWTFIGPPIVGKWAAGVFTRIDQFKSGGGAMLTFMTPIPPCHAVISSGLHQSRDTC